MEPTGSLQSLDWNEWTGIVEGTAIALFSRSKVTYMY